MMPKCEFTFHFARICGNFCHIMCNICCAVCVKIQLCGNFQRLKVVLNQIYWENCLSCIGHELCLSFCLHKLSLSTSANMSKVIDENKTNLET